MTSDNQTHAEIYLGIIDHVDDHAKVLGLAAMGLRLARLPEPESETSFRAPTDASVDAKALYEAKARAIDDANVRDRPEPEPIKPKPKPKPKKKYAKRISVEQALAVACPTCGAQPGEKCYVMARGNRYTEPKREEPEHHLTADQPHKEIHDARKEAAR